jgi:hypothetical protein
MAEPKANVFVVNEQRDSGWRKNNTSNEHSQ